MGEDRTSIDTTPVLATYNGQNLEELIGYVQDEYSCVYNGVNGTLYAGTDGLAFMGSFFLFDKKLFVKWVNVKVNRTDYSIVVQERNQAQPTVHEFLGIQNPQRCWSALVALHNQSLLDRSKSPAEAASTAEATITSSTTTEGDEEPTKPVHPRSQTAQPVHRRKQLRRMTSDPTSLLGNIDELFAGVNQDDAMMEDSSMGADRGEPATDSGTSVKSRRASLMQSHLVPPPPAKRASIVVTQDKAEVVSKIVSPVAPASGKQLSVTDTVGVVEVSPQSEIEAIVGKVQGRYACLWGRQRGILHAGSTALYFSGERLFFPARLTIQSSSIRQIKMVKSKPKSDSAPNDGLDEMKTAEEIIREQGIVVWTHDGTSHTFLGMENPDSVWASLVALRKHSSTGTNSPRPFAMRRMNSDPLFQSGVAMDLVSVVDGGDEETAKKTNKALPTELTEPVLSEEEVKKVWDKIMEKNSRYTTCVVKEQEFACSLDKFFKSYIDDGAEFGMIKFMEKAGEKDIKATAWKATNKDGKILRNRIVRYIHPVNAPLAPPEAKARKEQTYQRLGNYGIVVETKTFVDDVPMTDCFFVKDRLIVAAPTTGEKSDGRVLLTCEFELEFVKSTMFRGVITKTTTSEMTKFHQDMKGYMMKSVGAGAGAAEEVTKPVAEEVEKAAVLEEPITLPYGLTMTNVTHLLLLLVILMQFWILLELRSTKRAVRNLESLQIMTSPSTGFHEVDGSQQ